MFGGGFSLPNISSKMVLDVRGWRQSIERVKRDVRGVTGQLGQIGTAARAAALPMAAMGAAASAAMGLAVRAAMDVQESENLFEVSMGNMADATRQWSEELSSALGLNAAAVRRQVGTFNVMFDSMGFATEAANTMAKEITKLTYDMGSFYNLPHEEAFMKLQAGLSGEVEPLKRLGILVNESTVQQFAWANGIAETGQQLTEQQKVVARLGSIMEQTKKAQGDLARTSDSATNQWRRMTAQIDALRANIGSALIPAFSQWVGIASKSLSVAVGWVKEHKELAATLTRIAAGATLVGTAFAGLVLVTPSVVSTFTAFKALSISINALLVKMGVSLSALLAPIAAIAAAVAALGVAFYAWRGVINENLNGIGDAFRLAAQGLRELQQIVSDFWSPILGKGASWFSDKIKAELQTVKSVVNGFIGEIDKTLNLRWYRTALRDGMAAADKEALNNPYQNKGINFDWWGKAATQGIAAADRDALSRPNMDYLGGVLQATEEDLDAIGEKLKTFGLNLPETVKDVGAGAAKAFADDFRGMLEIMTGDLKASLSNWASMGDSTFEGYFLDNWKELLEGAEQSGGKIAKQASQAKDAMQGLADQGAALYRNLVPAEALVHEVTDSLLKLRAAGHLDDTTTHLLGTQLWTQFQTMAPMALDGALTRITAMGDEAARVAEVIRQAAEREQFWGAFWDGFEEIAQKSRDTRIEVEANWQELGDTFTDMGHKLNGVADTIDSEIGRTLGAAVASVGAMITSLQEVQDGFKGMAKIGDKSTSKVLSAVTSLTGGVFGAIGAVASLADAFGIFGKKGQEELKGMDRVLDELANKVDEWADRLTDAILEFVKTGKFEFNEFVNSVLEDMLRVVIRYGIIEPMISAKGNVFSQGNMVPFAKGGVFEQGKVMPFARGGIVNGPTLFPMPNKQIGMMGEAGPEAILPLERGAGGKLGVRAEGGVSVHIHDNRQSGEQVQVNSSRAADGSMMLDVVIADSVRRTMGRGELDADLLTHYGLRRRPV